MTASQNHKQRRLNPRGSVAIPSGGVINPAGEIRRMGCKGLPALRWRVFNAVVIHQPVIRRVRSELLRFQVINSVTESDTIRWLLSGGRDL